MRLVWMIQLIAALTVGCATTSKDGGADARGEQPASLRAELKAERASALADDPDAKAKIEVEGAGAPAAGEAGAAGDFGTNPVTADGRATFGVPFYVAAGIAALLFLYLLKLIFFTRSSPPQYAWKLR